MKARWAGEAWESEAGRLALDWQYWEESSRSARCSHRIKILTCGSFPSTLGILPEIRDFHPRSHVPISIDAQPRNRSCGPGRYRPLPAIPKASRAPTNPITHPERPCAPPPRALSTPYQSLTTHSKSLTPQKAWHFCSSGLVFWI